MIGKKQTKQKNFNKILQSLLLSVISLNSLANENVIDNSLNKKNNDKVVLPQLMKELKADKTNEYKALALQVKALQEDLDRESKNIHSLNKNILSVSNQFDNSNYTAFHYTKSLTYDLIISLEEKTLGFGKIFETNTVNKDTDFIVPFGCYMKDEWACQTPYEFKDLAGNKETGLFTYTKYEGLSNSNKLIFDEESYKKLMDFKNRTGQLTLITYTFPFQADYFQFTLTEK